MADVEHRTEIRRANRTTPIWIAVALVTAAVLFAATRSGDGGGDAAPEPTTTAPTSTPTTRPPGPLALVHVVADTDAGPRPATTADGPEPSGDSATFDAVQATPILTDGQIVLLVDGGTVLAGRPGGGFRIIDVGGPVSALIASNEPGHVWAVAPADTLVLVDLDGTDPPVRIALDGDRVIGPASFGVVTASPDGAAAWRRPSFDPAPVDSIGAGTPVDAGGDLVLVVEEGGSPGTRIFGIWSVVDGSLVRTFGVQDPDRPAALATDGTAVALPVDDGWLVRDSITGLQLGALPAAPGAPVWIGDGRFALLVDGAVAVSDGTVLSPPWQLRDVAEQSP